MHNATAKTSLLPCRRYPCDHAYRRSSHPVSVAEGEARHVISVDSRRHDNLEIAWSVKVQAFDDQPWRVTVHINPGTITLTADDADSLAAAIHRANTWALKANLKEAATA